MTAPGPQRERLALAPCSAEFASVAIPGSDTTRGHDMALGTTRETVHQAAAQQTPDSIGSRPMLPTAALADCKLLPDQVRYARATCR